MERPIRLTPGQAVDAPAAAELLADLAAHATLIADHASVTNPLRGLVTGHDRKPENHLAALKLAVIRISAPSI